MKKVILVLVLMLSMVSVASAQKVMLTWQAPTTYVDGGSLINFERMYKVYQGSTSGQYTTSVPVQGTESYEVDLAPGQYFFAVTAISGTSGLESGYSNEVSVTIASPPSPPTLLKIQIELIGK